MQIDKKHLEETLRHLGLIGLPELENKDQIWVYALCLVKKSNGRQEYVVVRHDIDDDGKETMAVIRDFGSVASIVQMGELRPYEYVTEMPRCPLKTTADIISFLARINQVDADTYKGMAKPKVIAHLKKALIENYKKHNTFSNGN